MKRFERSNGLDTALYKNYLYLLYNIVTIVQILMRYSVLRAAKLSLLNLLSLFSDLQKPTRFSGGGVVA